MQLRHGAGRGRGRRSREAPRGHPELWPHGRVADRGGRRRCHGVHGVLVGVDRVVGGGSVLELYMRRRAVILSPGSAAGDNF
jgi:hypothetical protein